MGKAIHDPEARYSEDGKRLYGFWKRIHTRSDSPEFEQFMGFYDWAMGNGYTDGARLYRYDREDPYSPENCFWVPTGGVAGIKETEKDYQPRDLALEQKWNDTVNRIRLHYGMEPIGSEENMEENETMSPDCNEPESSPYAAYKNGKEAMREAVVDKLRDMKGRAMGKDRALLSDIIEMVKKMEVVP